MPKNVDPEHAQMITEDLTELAMSLDENPSGPPPIAKKQGRGKGQPEGGLTQREVARLKNKRALLAKIQEQQKQTQSGSTPEVGTNEEGEEDRESKKVRDDEYS